MQNRDYVLILGLYVAAFAIRLAFAAQQAFPPLDDPAFYVQTARNLAGGRGLTIDVIYNYWVHFETVTHASHEYWMPFTTLLMAGFMRLLGDTPLVEHLPGIISGAGLPVITYVVGRTLWSMPVRWAAMAALWVAVGAVPVYQAGTLDSMSLYALLSTLALLAAARAIDGGQWRWAVVAGGLCGLSYLTRSHGSLLAMSIGLVGWLALSRKPRRAVQLTVAGVAGYLCVVVPWWLRNASVFGSISPMPYGALIAALDNNQWYNYAALPSLGTLNWSDALAVRAQALWQLLGVSMLITFPYGLIGLPAIFRRRETVNRLFVVYAGLLFLVGGVLIPTSGLSGSFYHSAGIFAMFAALGAAGVVAHLAASLKGRVWAFAVGSLIFGLLLGQAAVAWPTFINDSRANAAKFTTAAAWLRSNVPPDQAVITNEAHSLNYASGYATLTLPNQEDATVVAQLAERYDARFVVMFGPIGLYPAALDQSNAAFKRFAQGDIVIYELRRR